MYSQTATQLVRAPRSAVYAALLDPRAAETWRVPDDMTARVAEWEPVEGGRFRVSLTYRAEDRTGKTEGATDTYSGHFDAAGPRRAGRGAARVRDRRPRADRRHDDDVDAE